MSVPLASQDIQLRPVPAGRGATWVRQGFAVFFARPLALSCLLGLFLLAMLTMMLVPWIGPLLFLCSLPLVTLSFMLATQLTLAGESPSPTVFVRPLRVDRDRSIALGKLGLLYAVGTVAIMLVCNWLDAGKMMALQDAMASETATRAELQARFADPQLQQGLLWRLALSSLLSLPFWHAPALVYWGGQRAGKALFFSSVAIWRTKAAFLVYTLVGMGLVLAFGLAGTVLLTLSGQPQQWAGLIVMPGMLMFANVFYASLFFTFADSFELSPSEGPLSAA